MTFSNLTAPITKLLQNEVPFEWSAECDKNFEEIKRLIADNIKLYFLDYDQEIYMRADASKIGCGAQLYQIIMARREQLHLRRKHSQRQSKDGVLSNRKPLQCFGQ